MRGVPGSSTHGTRSHYVRGCRCDECTKANRDYQTVRIVQRKKLLASGAVTKQHGNINTYNNWGCRCNACTEAQKLRCRAYHARVPHPSPAGWVVE
jgi:hypothetical protein